MIVTIRPHETETTYKQAKAVCSCGWSVIANVYHIIEDAETHVRDVHVMGTVKTAQGEWTASR